MIFYPRYRCERCGEMWLILPAMHTYEDCDYHIKQERERMVREILCLSIATVPVHRYREVNA